jgi:serine/threonine protein kinase
MHRLGVHHTDLNCRNILLDGDGQIWLIDFDKCNRRPQGRWIQDSLDRLERSLLKERTKVPHLHWTDPDWGALLEGHRVGLTPDARQAGA